MKKILTRWSAPMKGLMVTLLVFLGSGSALAQQSGGNDFSANNTNRSATLNSGIRTNQTRMQPLKRSFNNTSLRVAQSSSTGSGGFNVTSRETIGGTDYKEGAGSGTTQTPPNSASDRNQTTAVPASRGIRNPIGQQPAPVVRQNNSSRNVGQGFPSGQTSPAVRNAASNGVRSNSLPPQNNSQLRAWPLPVSPEWERTLKSEGYIYAPIKPQERNSIGEIVMFQDNSQFSNRSGTGSIVTSQKWDVYKNTAIIDVDEFSLQEIQKGTLSLRDLGAENLTGVALRYVREDGSKIPEQLIGNIPGNAPANQAVNRSNTPTNQVDTRNNFGLNQTASARGSRPNERQFDSFDQQNDTFSQRAVRRDDRNNFDSQARNSYDSRARNDYDGRDRNSADNGGWNLNDDQQIRRPQQTFREDNFASQRDSRDRYGDDRYGDNSRDSRDRYRDDISYDDDSRDFNRGNNRRMSNEYFDGLGRQDFDDRDQRDVDYVRNRINENRNDDYSSRDNFRLTRDRNDSRDDDRYSRSNRDYDDGRTSDYDRNFESQRKELQDRLLYAQRVEERNAEDAVWLKRQRESIEKSRLARYYDEDLTPLPRQSTAGRNYLDGRQELGRLDYGRQELGRLDYRGDRLADRSTDPVYGGQRTDALTPVRPINASADRVAQILAEKEADLDAKIGAIDHLLKLDSAGRNLDAKINSLKQVKSPQNNGDGRVHSLVSRTVQGTLGGDMAAPRLASTGTSPAYDGLSGGALPLDINSYSQRGPGTRVGQGTRVGEGPRGGGFGNDSESGSGDGRMLRLMWLLLLISLGANVYLAILSRSFYTQYEELADELRDTFSSSSSI